MPFEAGFAIGLFVTYIGLNPFLDIITTECQSTVGSIAMQAGYTRLQREWLSIDNDGAVLVSIERESGIEPWFAVVVQLDNVLIGEIGRLEIFRFGCEFRIVLRQLAVFGIKVLDGVERGSRAYPTSLHTAIGIFDNVVWHYQHFSSLHVVSHLPQEFPVAVRWNGSQQITHQHHAFQKVLMCPIIYLQFVQRQSLCVHQTVYIGKILRA